MVEDQTVTRAEAIDINKSIRLLSCFLVLFPELFLSGTSSGASSVPAGLGCRCDGLG